MGFVLILSVVYLFELRYLNRYNLFCSGKFKTDYAGKDYMLNFMNIENKLFPLKAHCCWV